MPRPHNPLRVQHPVPECKVYITYHRCMWRGRGVRVASGTSNEAVFAARPRSLATAAINTRCIDELCCWFDHGYGGAMNRCVAPTAYIATTWPCGTRACPVLDTVNIFPTISSSPQHVKNRGLHLSSSASTTRCCVACFI